MFVNVANFVLMSSFLWDYAFMDGNKVYLGLVCPSSGASMVEWSDTVVSNSTAFWHIGSTPIRSNS
jgi:hypothetical protein